MRKIAMVGLVLLSAAIIWGQVNPPPTPLHKVGDHWTPYDPPTEFPEGANVYIIQPGDTLWDLAAKFLGDPYLWPQLWEKNQYIKDSHWIYPGDPLLIETGGEAVAQTAPPEAGMEAGAGETAQPEAAGAGEEAAGTGGEVQPAAEEGPKAELIPTLAGSPSDVNCFAILAPDESIFPFSIKSAEEMEFQDHFSDGDVVYIDGGTAEGVKAGDMYFIVEKYRKLRHPVSKADMGWIFRRKGTLKVLCAQEHTSICEIMSSCDPISIGDLLQPYAPIPLPLTLPEKAPTSCDAPSGKPTGYVIYQRDDVIDAGTHRVIMLDLGSSQGAYEGQYVTLFRDNPVKGMPRIILGQANILTVADNYSTAVIVQANGPVRVGDRAELR